jgi:transposase
MARYKHIDTSPRFLPVDLTRQLRPGTFEYALNHLLDGEIDLRCFDDRFNNDDTGASAYPPAMLLKVVLFAYSQGILSSRAIERACCEQVTFIALTGDQAPHFTTIARFISTLGDDIANVFTQVLFICDSQGLIGREMFAIDGVKLPSNASKAKSGTRADFVHQAKKLEKSVKVMLKRHREADDLGIEPDVLAKEIIKRKRLQEDAAKLRQWLNAHPEDRTGKKGNIRKSNRTDNESAKMATGKGVIQGYTGVAAVDDKYQIIVEAQAHGTGSEHEVFIPVVDAMSDLFAPDSLLTADAGYHSEANLAILDDRKIAALVADNGMRKRDERFATQERHASRPDPLANKSKDNKKAKLYQTRDFLYDADTRTCICPAGKTLYRWGTGTDYNGFAAVRFAGAPRDCRPCQQRHQCLRYPDKTEVRSVAIVLHRLRPSPQSHTDRMKKRIDSAEGRARYGRRFATVEPVFANLRYNKGLDRFTLRGKEKVDAQWKLFCLVHNIEKLAHYGYVQ